MTISVPTEKEVRGMARLIDAKALEKQIKESFKETNPVLMGQMLRWVRKQTTIDAVHVVRCRDCFANECCSVQIDLDMGGDGYCPKGRRKDNG
jgi:hypothetical protein